jgi:hypothetical protein
MMDKVQRPSNSECYNTVVRTLQIQLNLGYYFLAWFQFLQLPPT